MDPRLKARKAKMVWGKKDRSVCEGAQFDEIEGGWCQRSKKIDGGRKGDADEPQKGQGKLEIGRAEKSAGDHM